MIFPKKPLYEQLNAFQFRHPAIETYFPLRYHFIENHTKIHKTSQPTILNSIRNEQITG